MKNRKFEFKNHSETFTLIDPKASYLYFPITNGYDLKGSITPTLNGDLKLGQNHFALLPVSQEDLENSSFGRHFWLNITGYGLYNASGVSAKQKMEQSDKVEVEAGLLYHQVTRSNNEAGVEITSTTFAPFEKTNIELTKITIKNISDQTISFKPTAVVPLFSRSADNLRDHRHVTALLNRATVVKNGIVNQPTLSFDERGHLQNKVSYGVFVNGEKNDQVIAYNPKLQEFVGEGYTLDWPLGLLNDIIGQYQVGDIVSGYEVVGAIQLQEVTLHSNEEHSYVLAICIDEQGGYFDNILSDYCNIERFDLLLKENKHKWQEKLQTFSIRTGDEEFDHWVKWVALQPILRRIYGCSFLPHHDYGRGGRGWRDLWQDCLALLLMESEGVEYLLYNNFGGVRIDGSNATIIGSKPGEFVADRNNIPRLWMDHGVWPWNTTKLYIERSGQYDFLFKTQRYFKDAITHFAKKKDDKWSNSLGNYQLTSDGSVYEGTILEHILVQNITQFFNVGEHNNIRLEGADWNDGLDMARVKGESVTFTSFYMMNLSQIADCLKDLKAQGMDTIRLYKELVDLMLDDIDYNNVDAKQAHLKHYFNQVTHTITGEMVDVLLDDVMNSLTKKVNWLKEHLQQNEWLTINDHEGFFNGYYDNHGNKLEGIVNNELRMTLTGQVFPIMSGLATTEQIQKILTAANHYLYDESVSGYRLNNNFNEVKLDMGRLFGFAFGHKENGAMFSHMAMMFANGLYKRDFVSEGYKILKDISNHCLNFDKARIYPGIPEYLDMDGRGMYHYLTGSASWYIMNVVNEMFGVKGYQGNLCILPKLVKSQFNDEHFAEISTEFNHQIITVKYINNENKEVNHYQINEVYLNGNKIAFEPYNKGAIINKELLNQEDITIEVYLK